MKATIQSLFFAGAMLCAAQGFAQTAPDFQRDVLRPIDTMPNAAWLDANFEDPQGLLIEAATSTEDSYERRRAITLLSLYPNARSRAALEKVAVDGDPKARELAVYALGRTYGQVADAKLVSFIAGVASGEGRTAQWAVRALRWVVHPDAISLLQKLGAEEGPNAGIARRALRLHVSKTSQSTTR